MSETQQHVEEPGPSEVRSPLIQQELKRAGVWLALAVAIALVVVLAQPLMLIIGALVLATMMDGGTRLLGRVLPISRGWRLTIVLLSAVAFLALTFYLTGSSLAAQARTASTESLAPRSSVLTAIDAEIPGGRAFRSSSKPREV